MRTIKNILFAIVAILFLGVLLFLLIPTKKTPDQPAVIQQIKELSRLETITYSLEKIVEEGDSKGPLQDFLFGDKILFVAYGEVIAGIDFSLLKENAVAINGEKLEIQLPPAQVLTTRLDNTKSRVYNRTTGLFTKGNKDLESTARIQAENLLTKAACEDGILTKANEQAVKQMTSLFKGLGFSSVNIKTTISTCN